MPAAVVRRSDRLWDAAAVLLAVGGATAFLVARHVLGRIAAGTWPIPAGTSWVETTERFDQLSRAGVWAAAAGIAVGVVAALRHRRAARA